MRIEMVDPQSQLIEELKAGCSQKSIALTYAFIMRQEGDKADWPRINAAILKRWPSMTALVRIKKLAWKHCFAAAPVETGVVG